MDQVIFEPKQQQALQTNDVDILLLGGARGGGKSFVLAAKMAMNIEEWIPASEAKQRHLDISSYRSTNSEDGLSEIFYYKYTIDYADYFGVIVRKTEPALMAQTHKECKKIYPILGGKWSNKEWVFPSGANIIYRPCQRPEHLEWFQGMNVHRLGVEELTQFDEDAIQIIEACNRSSHPIIKAKKFFTTNPGNRGHHWVKKKYVDTCRSLPDGDPIYVEKYKLSYQPVRSGKPYTNPKTEESHLFIPSLVFDNRHLSERDDQFVRNLQGKNHILREMWLNGNWDVFAGQFFDMWDEGRHVVSELEFFNAANNSELILNKRKFDWKSWRLYMSNDYGYAEKSAWACGFYAVSDETDKIIKFAEIVKPGLTILQQARETKEFIKTKYNLSIDDFELVIADPKSYWQRQDKGGEEFYDFATVYQDEGIHLTKGLNDREHGAMAFLEALRIREDGTPQMQFLDCCVQTIESIPALPADAHNLNDVDTTIFDHPYDEGRYFLMVLKGSPYKENHSSQKKDWRDLLSDFSQKLNPKSWKVA